MLTDETKPADFKNIRGTDHSHIKGWGVDADPENDPTYPMKMRTDEEQLGYSWERPVQQDKNMEVLKSVERPNITAVFGTSIPPSGLSGMIRRFAFKYSESTYLHWLPLIMADRVNMIEGIIDDLSRGHIPNIVKERGWTAEWKYNRMNVIKNVAIGIVLTAVLIAVLAGKNKKSKSLM